MDQKLHPCLHLKLFPSMFLHPIQAWIPFSSVFLEPTGITTFTFMVNKKRIFHNLISCEMEKPSLANLPLFTNEADTIFFPTQTKNKSILLIRVYWPLPCPGPHKKEDNRNLRHPLEDRHGLGDAREVHREHAGPGVPQGGDELRWGGRTEMSLAVPFTEHLGICWHWGGSSEVQR